ncbi:hypothetical protein HY251_18900, partial [bacterium]|nr:hypothetical protein [bacterium]
MLDLLAVDWNEAIRVSKAGTVALGPECVLVATACIAILIDLLIPKEKSGSALATVAMAGAIGAFALVWRTYLLEPTSVFWGAVVIDRFASFFKLVILCGTVLSIVLVEESAELRGRSMGEFYGLLFSAVAGMFFMVGANDMVTAFLSIELVSVPSFALVAYLRQDRRGTEASLKYVLYGAFSTGLMLFGLSIFFGLTHSTSFAALTHLAPDSKASALTIGF